jgi:signal peptidase I
MKLRWFVSSTVRQATDMVKHVQKLLNAQRDVLSSQALEGVSGAMRDTQAALDEGAADEALEKQMAKLEAAATKWIKPYPDAEWRENIEVFLVAIVVAMAIRTFFLQPFKIPTGSMEPTLYGIEINDLRDQPDAKVPNGLERFWDVIFYGAIYHHIIAPEDGQVENIGPLQHVFGFINKQTIWVRYRGEDHETALTIWCGPDGRVVDLSGHTSGLEPGYLQSPFSKGEAILSIKETTGDHLFVDRVTYNFRRPRRGDIIVFKTEGIKQIPDQRQFYIKRLVALPGETVSIGDDQHARINGHRLDATTPHFENVYGFDPKAPKREGKYGQWNGHLLQTDPRSRIQTTNDSITVDPGHYVVFGDNTMNSLDSRYWGELPEQNVIGKSFFVYWPFSHRFGWNSILY